MTHTKRAVKSDTVINEISAAENVRNGIVGS